MTKMDSGCPSPENDDDQKPELLVMSPEGDIIFVVGEGEEQRRMKVLSHFLRATSPVFKAMLGPNYSDGKGLSTETPKEIPLPEDDPEAMEIIFNAVHLKNSAIKDPLDSDQVLRTAIAADKYDLVEALKFCAKSWFLLPRPDDDVSGFWRLSLAACWLRHHEGFELATAGLLGSYGGPYVELGLLGLVTPGISTHLIARLEEKRQVLRLNTISLVIDIGLQIPSVEVPGECGLGGPLSCGYAKIRGFEFMAHVLKEGSKPAEFSGSTLKKMTSSITKRMLNLPGCAVDTESKKKCPKFKDHSAVDSFVRVRVQEAIGKMEKQIEGLSFSSLDAQEPDPSDIYLTQLEAEYRALFSGISS